MVDEEVRYCLDFSDALLACKSGHKIVRAGWNGKGMWVCYVPGRSDLPLAIHLPYLAMKTVDDKIVPWLASQTDLLATDWETIIA